MINQVIGTVRKIVSDLRPVIIEELGLTAALQWYTRDFSKRTSIHCILTDYDTPEQLDNMVSNTIYRIYQESLTNVARHSQATEVRSELTCENGILNLTIKDNGIGFDPEILKTKKSFGILGIRERALMINGDFNLESKINQGTIMTVRVNLASGNN
jgi:signal transduction histidine kinase